MYLEIKNKNFILSFLVIIYFININSLYAQQAKDIPINVSKSIYQDQNEVSYKKIDKSDTKKEFGERDAPKRPEELECDIYHTSVKGQKWVVLVGLLSGKPYEVIGGEASQIEIPRKFKKGMLTKMVRF